MTDTASNRWAQWALGVAMFLVGLMLAIIVSKAYMDAPTSGSKEKRREAEGADSHIQYIHVPGVGKVPYEPLFEAVSKPGESLDGFMVRIGARLVAYSDATGFEACGTVASDGVRFGVMVGSNHAHLSCASFRVKVPVGMTSTGQTIHSHGNGAARMTTADIRFLGLSEDSRSRRMFSTVYGQDRFHFSERDRAGGPGYLATPSGVIYQDGEGHVRPVSP